MILKVGNKWKDRKKTSCPSLDHSWTHKLKASFQTEEPNAQFIVMILNAGNKWKEGKKTSIVLHPTFIVFIFEGKLPNKKSKAHQ